MSSEFVANDEMKLIYPRQGKIDPKFQDTYDKLIEIRNHLERLTMTQAWSLSGLVLTSTAINFGVRAFSDLFTTQALKYQLLLSTLITRCLLTTVKYIIIAYRMCRSFE